MQPDINRELKNKNIKITEKIYVKKKMKTKQMEEEYKKKEIESNETHICVCIAYT